MIEYLLYMSVGVFAGFSAGLLGVGGGLVVVPVLIMIYQAQGLAQTHLAHLAVGTSLASIVFTSISSLLAHNRRGAVDWKAFARLTPGILLGAQAGAWFAAGMSTAVLKGFLAVFLFLVALQMFLNLRPKTSRGLPGGWGLALAGLVIGCISAMAGIGGGMMTVPLLLWFGVAMTRAVGTSAAVGLPIALAGAAGFIVNGWGAEGLPPWCLGFVHLPALAGVVCLSVLTAPLGARLAHRLPAARLKRIFALYLFVVSIKMMLEFF